MAKISEALRKILRALRLAKGKKEVAAKPAVPAKPPAKPPIVPKPEPVVKPSVPETKPKPEVAPKQAPLAAPAAIKPKHAIKPPKPKTAAKPGVRPPRPAPPKAVPHVKLPAPPKPMPEKPKTGEKPGVRPPRPKKIVGKKPKKKRKGKRKISGRVVKKPKKAKKSKIRPEEKHRRAALRGWRTRRRKLKARLLKLEVQTRRTATTEKRIGKLRGQLVNAREREVELMEREIGEVPVRGEDIKEIRMVRETADRIEREVREQVARMPVSVPHAVYAITPEVKLSIDDEIGIIRRMMKALEREFYKRRINENEFRKAMFEYQQELRELEERKKAIEEVKKRPPEAAAVGPPAAAKPPTAAAAAGPGVAPPGGGAIGAAAHGAGLAELQLKTIEELRKLATVMKDDARQRAYAAPAPAVAAPAVAAARPGAPAAGYPAVAVESTDSRISASKNKIKALEKEFYKRRVSPEEFKKAMFEYQQELRELEAKKKAAETAKGVAEEAKKVKVVETKPKPVVARAAWPAAAPAKPPRAAAQPRMVLGRPANVEPMPRVVGKPAAEMPGAKTDLGRIVAKRAAGEVDEERLATLEKRMQTIMVKYGIPKGEVEEQVMALSSEKILENFSRLIEIIEAQKKVEAEGGPEIKRAPVETIAPGEVLMAKPKPEVIAMGIKRRSIVTVFDRVLAKVVESGEVKVGKLSKELGIKKKRMGEVLDVLEDRKLVEIQYPAFGDAVVRIPGYVKPKKAKKNKGKGDRGKGKNEGGGEPGGGEDKGGDKGSGGSELGGRENKGNG